MTIKRYKPNHIKSKKHKPKSKYKSKSKKYRNKTKRLGGAAAEVAIAAGKASEKLLFTTAKLIITGVNATSTVLEGTAKGAEIVAAGTKDLIVTGSQLTIKIGKQSLKFADQATTALFGVFNALYLTGEFIAIIYFNLLNTCASFVTTQLTDLKQISEQCRTPKLGQKPCKQLYLGFLDKYYKNTLLYYKKIFVTHKKSLIHNKYEGRVKLLTLSCKKTWSLNEDYNWKIQCQENSPLQKLEYQEKDSKKIYQKTGDSTGGNAFTLYSNIKDIHKQFIKEYNDFIKTYHEAYIKCREGILTLNGFLKPGDEQEIELYNTKIIEFMTVYNISDKDVCEKNISTDGQPICEGDVILRKGLIYTQLIEPTLTGSNNHLKELSNLYLPEQANKLITPTPEDTAKDKKIDTDMNALNDKILKSSENGELSINRDLNDSQSIVSKAFVGTQGAKPGVEEPVPSTPDSSPLTPTSPTPTPTPPILTSQTPTSPTPPIPTPPPNPPNP
jgi:hypothetical protein